MSATPLRYVVEVQSAAATAVRDSPVTLSPREHQAPPRACAIARGTVARSRVRGTQQATTTVRIGTLATRRHVGEVLKPLARPAAAQASADVTSIDGAASGTGAPKLY